jgi:aldehyde dehydrogenase (NAD+)
VYRSAPASPFAARARGYIKHGVAEGARLVTGGADRPEGLEKGFFGPVLCVLAHEDEDDAVRRPP